MRTRYLTGRALAFLVAMSASTASNAILLRVTIENVMPAQGGIVTPLHFAFHDGDYQAFEPGTSASPGLEWLAEDAIIGLEPTIPGLVEAAIAAGLDTSVLPAFEQTLAGEFLASSSGQRGGVQGIITETPVGIVPGARLSKKVEVDENDGINAFFSFAAMFIPSNDGFFANTDKIRVIGEGGAFIAQDFLVLGSEIWDAGTELNTDDTLDDVLATIPLNLAVVGQGTAEDEVVRLHQGLGAGALGIADFANADFTLPGYQVARLTIIEVPEAASTLGLVLLGGLGGLVATRRRLGRLT